MGLKPLRDYQSSLVSENLVPNSKKDENLLLARHQLIENDRIRNGNREALMALRKRARITKTSIPSPFEPIMKEIEGPESSSLVKELCATSGNHDSKENTWMMFPGTDIFTRIPFHAAHTILGKDDVMQIKHNLIMMQRNYKAIETKEAPETVTWEASWDWMHSPGKVVSLHQLGKNG
ncbi:hypothetical protein F0562_019076 [Nyssa sinensis]|uniref:Uncharacterized protein n=1 Tax=Nyssa sinensis TaxID=561372 RepID=A0A5J4ZF99_9ASTE|nr:hypothetical protein F0562_019076 [Nyssa sinensis]